MNQLVRRRLERTSLYHPLRNWVVRRRQAQKFIEWEKNGKPAPPPHLVKQRALRAYAQQFGLKILVETGTYYGDMLEAMKDDFERLYSIELSTELHEKARRRFKSHAHIQLLHGDSGVELKNLLARIDKPTLFWLDGHHCAGETAKADKDTPIYEELAHILNAPDRGHVIVVDDARLFGTDPQYPTVAEISDFAKSKRPSLAIEVEDDSIRITPER